MKEIPAALNIPPGDSWQEPVRAYLDYLPLPNEGVSITEMIINGAQLLEAELEQGLNEKEVTISLKSFAGKISAARKTIEDPARKSLWDALDKFRVLRNAYAHHMKNEVLKAERGNEFIRFTEDFMGISGDHIYPSAQRQAFGLHIGITLVWESLCKFRGAPETFSMVNAILTKYTTELQKADQQG